MSGADGVSVLFHKRIRRYYARDDDELDALLSFSVVLPCPPVAGVQYTDGRSFSATPVAVVYNFRDDLYVADVGAASGFGKDMGDMVREHTDAGWIALWLHTQE